MKEARVPSAADQLAFSTLPSYKDAGVLHLRTRKCTDGDKTGLPYRLQQDEGVLGKREGNEIWNFHSVDHPQESTEQMPIY